MQNEDADQLDEWPFPTGNDQLIVEAHPTRGGTYVAEHIGERLYRMINGFHEAGDLLVQQSDSESPMHSNLIYPAIFAYRQSLELHLKYFSMAYGRWAGEQPDFRTHDLSGLNVSEFISSLKEDPNQRTTKHFKLSKI
jgi:hypothetical protein